MLIPCYGERFSDSFPSERTDRRFRIHHQDSGERILHMICSRRLYEPVAEMKPLQDTKQRRIGVRYAVALIMDCDIRLRY